MVATGVTASDWIGIVGAAIAIVGVAIALVQARRAETTAEAAATAVADTQRQVSGAMLLLRTPELEAVEVKIRQEAAAGDNDGASAAIRDWRRIAPEYQALMRSSKLIADDLAGHLEVSLALVDVALEELADGVSTVEACKRILREISLACATSRGAAVGMMMSSS